MRVYMEERGQAEGLRIQTRCSLGVGNSMCPRCQLPAGSPGKGTREATLRWVHAGPQEARGRGEVTRGRLTDTGLARAVSGGYILA